MKNLTAIAVIIIFSIISAFSQDSIESLNKNIEANPNVAENYMKRYEFYKDAWEKDQEDFASLARGLADLSKYISLKSDDAEAYRIRAAVRKFLFLGVNPFTIADLKKVVALDPKDKGSAALLFEYQAEYAKKYRTTECKEARSKYGFQGHPDDEPDTALTMSLYPFDDEEFDYKLALKYLGCGADAKYRYKQFRQIPEFNDVRKMHPINVIAMLEAGASPNSADKLGNTVLMMSFEDFNPEIEKKDEENLIQNLKTLLFYGANVNAKNLKGQNVMYFAKKTKNKEVIALLEKSMAKNFDGIWIFDDGRFGLTVEIKVENGKLTGDYSNFSSKTSEGKILSSKINGNTATIEIDCDWGGKGTAQITLLKGNKLHWKIIKRDEKDGDFIVLIDQILTKK